MSQLRKTHDELAAEEAITSAVALGFGPTIDACSFIQLKRALLIDATEDPDYPQVPTEAISSIDWRRYTMSANEYATELALDSVTYHQQPIH